MSSVLFRRGDQHCYGSASRLVFSFRRLRGPFQSIASRVSFVFPSLLSFFFLSLLFTSRRNTAERVENWSRVQISVFLARPSRTRNYKEALEFSLSRRESHVGFILEYRRWRNEIRTTWARKSWPPLLVRILTRRKEKARRQSSGWLIRTEMERLYISYVILRVIEERQHNSCDIESSQRFNVPPRYLFDRSFF